MPVQLKTSQYTDICLFTLISILVIQTFHNKPLMKNVRSICHTLHAQSVSDHWTGRKSFWKAVDDLWVLLTWN